MFDATSDAPETGATAAGAADPRPDRSAENRRRLVLVRNIALGSLAAVALGVGIIYGPTAFQVFQQRNTTIETPPDVAGLRLDSSDGAKETAEYVRDAIATSVALDKSTGAVYTDTAADNRTVIFVGGSGPVWKPKDALRDMFAVITDDTGGVQSVKDVDAGELGGVMRCGSTATPDGDLVVCGWADHGSAAVALFANRTVDESASLLRTMRKSLEQRD